MITGATGYIGGRLAPRLLASGYSIRCLVRSPAKLQGRKWVEDSRVEVRQADLADAESLARNLEGCQTAFYLVHSMTSAGAKYADQDRRLASVFAHAARQAGVGRLIYLGGLGETGPDLSQHLSSRREVEEALASTGVPVTVLRAAMIIGSGSASFEIMRYLVERLPIMITPRWVSTPCQPIAVRNVIGYLVGALSKPEMAGSTFDIGGPDVLCYRDIMRVLAEELGLRRRWILPVPVLSPRLSSYWIHLITPLSHRIAKPLAEGLKNPVVCRENRITKLIPQELLTVREAIRAALRNVTENQVETNWSMAGPIPSDPDWAGGAVFRDEREIVIEGPDWAVFRAVCRVGGGHGWYAAAWLWRIRGWIDVVAGGPGLRRGRRDSEMVRYGEALDFWRVVGLERNRRLVLRAEMKLPGEALIEFRIQARGEFQCMLQQRALFHPRGLFGLLYWYAVAPLHHMVFRGMLLGIRRKALILAAGRERRAGPTGEGRSHEGKRDSHGDGTSMTPRRRDFLGAAGIATVTLAVAGFPLGALGDAATGQARLKIGIIGAGRIGGTLGEHWVKAGHEVLLSSRHPESLKPLADRLGPLARVGTPREAAAFGEIILVSIPYGALPQVGRDHAEELRGKIVLDPGNPFPQRDGPMAEEARKKGTATASLAYLGGVRLVRAFNTIPASVLRSEAHRAGERIAVPLASDDQQALEVAARLVRDAGFEPVLVGPLARSRHFDVGTAVFGRGLTARELRRGLGLEP